MPLSWTAQLLFLERLPVAQGHTSWCAQIHKAVLFKKLSQDQVLIQVVKCCLAGKTNGSHCSYSAHPICMVTVPVMVTLFSLVADYTETMKEPTEGSSPVGQRRRGKKKKGGEKKTTILICHSFHMECWDCPSDCRISINLEMQLDAGASDREGETLSRSITSLACHSYMQPDWFI